jgi:hypothetical protein
MEVDEYRKPRQQRVLDEPVKGERNVREQAIDRSYEDEQTKADSGDQKQNSVGLHRWIKESDGSMIPEQWEQT